jgi:PAS domain S-box-containing protein
VAAETHWPLLRDRPIWPLVAAANASPFARVVAAASASGALALAYALVGAPGVWLLHHILGPDLATLAPTLGVPWLPVGIAVAGLMLFGLRAFPGVFVGSCLTWGLVQGDPWISVTIDAVGETASTVLIVWLLRVWGYRPSLARHQDALILVLAAALGRVLSSCVDVIATFAVASAFSTPDTRDLLEAAGVYKEGGVFFVHMSLFTASVRWWGNSVAGIVLIVPLLAPFAATDHARHTPRRGEFLGWTLLMLAWLVVAFMLPAHALRVVLLAAALALVVSAALRFGVTAASAATLLFSVSATVGFALQLGVFAGIGGRERMEVAWGFIGLLAGAGLFLTPMLAGRADTQRRLVASVERYRRLFFANPSPMWAEEATSGRILLVNDAAVRAYGHNESAFLRLRGQDLLAEHAAAETGATPYETRHRTAGGEELAVEVTPVAIELDGAALRVCFVDIIDERNDLKLAVLSAADKERHRLGQAIRDGLGPILARLAARIDELAVAATCNEPLDLGLTLAAEADAIAASAKCRQLNRGASPLHFASGDLLAALRRIPEELTTETGPELTVSVWQHAPVELSLERCEHVYRIAHDAVRAAMLRPGARRVEVAVDVTSARISVAVDDDGAPAGRSAAHEAVALWPLDVRAAAARAQLSIGTRHGGGNRVSFDCSQTLDQPQPVGTVGGHGATAALGGPAMAKAGARERYGAALRTLVDGISLFLACFAAGAIGLSFLQIIDPRHVALLPSVAIPWIASGVSATGLFLGGARLAPAVFLGTIAVWRGLNHDPWITVLADGLGETLAAMMVAQLLVRFGFRRSFDRFRDLATLVAVAALSRLVPALFDAAGLHLAGALAPGTLTPELREGLESLGPRFLGLTPLEVRGYAGWWINGVAGVVLVIPAVVPVSAELRAMLRRRWAEASLFAPALVGAVVAIAGGPPANWRLSLLGLAVVLVAWAAVRFGVALASTATLLFSLAATVGFGFGLGPIAAAHPGEGVEVLWGFIGLLGATGLFLTTVVAEHEGTMRGLKALQARYEALFEAIPRPLFAFNPPAGRITMVNAEAIRRYGYDREQFLCMTPTMLAADPESETPVEARAVQGRTLQPGLHRTRSGERFDVELSITRVAVGEQVEDLCFAIDVTERDDLRRRVLEASDLERRRLAQELHDSLGQSLTGLQLGIVSVRRTLERDGSARKDAVLFVSGAIKDAIASCRQIVHGLSPLHATDGDLVAALRRLPLELPPADRERLNVEVRADSALRLPLAMREHLYQIARESVNNALKHADAQHIAITMDVSPTTIRLAIEDDGKGFDPAARRLNGLGLRSLTLRAGALRGRLAIERRPVRGIAVICRCPQTGA